MSVSSICGLSVDQSHDLVKLSVMTFHSRHFYFLNNERTRDGFKYLSHDMVGNVCGVYFHKTTQQPQLRKIGLWSRFSHITKILTSPQWYQTAQLVSNIFTEALKYPSLKLVLSLQCKGGESVLFVKMTS